MEKTLDMASVVTTMRAITLTPASTRGKRKAMYNGKKIATYEILGKEADATYADLHYTKPVDHMGWPCWGNAGILHQENGPLKALAHLALHINGLSPFDSELADEAVCAYLTD